MIIQNDGDILQKAVIQKLPACDPDDRHYAAELLLHTSIHEGLFLIELLNDSDPKVRSTAIRSSIKKWETSEVINALIENLKSHIYIK